MRSAIYAIGWLAAASMQSTDAASLATFDFEAGNLGPASVAPYLSVSNITPAAGNTNLSVETRTNPNDLRISAVTAPVTSASQAVSENQYATISLAADPGFSFNLDTFDLDIARGGSSTPRGFVLRSSVDNFSTDLFAADADTVRPDYAAAGGVLGSGFENLTSITFRLYAYGSPNAGSAMYFDNIAITGAVVPIPAAVWLFGSALAGLGVIGRRRKEAA